MGILTSAVKTASKGAKSVYNFGANKIKNAIAANQADDIIDPESGIIAKTIGIAADVANIATFNGLRTVTNKFKKEYSTENIKEINQDVKDGKTKGSVEQRLDGYLKSEGAAKALKKRGSELDKYINSSYNSDDYSLG